MAQDWFSKYQADQGPSPAPQAPVDNTNWFDKFQASQTNDVGPTRESKDLNDQEYKDYTKLLQDKNTTPETLSKWFTDKGYGTPNNAGQVLEFHRKHPDIAPLKTFIKLGADPITSGSKPSTQIGVPEEPRKWGLDPETLKMLGYQDMNDPRNRVSPLRWLESLPAATADTVVRGLQAGQYGIDQLAEMADKFYQGSGVDRAVADITGVHQRPSELIGGLPEAFPLAGTELGGFKPSFGGATEARIAATETLDRFGVKPEDLPPGVTPEQAAKTLTETRGFAHDAANFKGTPEPKPTDVFPTDESRAADAEAWGKSLGAPEPKPVETPVDTTIPEEPGISKKEANDLFKQEFGQKPSDMSVAEWSKALEEQASKWKKGEDLPSEEPTVTAETATPKAQGANESPNTNTNIPVEDVVDKLTNLLKGAGAASTEQKRLYAEERGKRLADVARIQKEGGGRAAMAKSLAALQGELPKAEFESVKQNFTPQEVDTLFEAISQHPKLSPGAKVNAQQGLEKLLNGELPQPKQLENLGQVFPPEFIKAALSKRSALKKAGGLFGEIWNAPKSLQSTADLSAPLRQGLGLIHRGEFWKSLGPMVKAAFSPKTEKALEEAITSHPNYDLSQEAGLSITTAGKLGLSEDMFKSHLAEKIPGWGKVVQGSERAYVGFLNKLRFDTFNSMIAQAEKLGYSKNDPEVARGIANYINVMTGRGGLGKLEPATEVLNNIAYSPGLISSRLQILTAPVTSVTGKGFISELPKGMRVEAAKSYAGIIAFNSTALTLAYMAGKSVNLDPRSSDFMKLKDGDTRLDFGGGLQQYIVAGARAFTRERTNSGENGVTKELKGQGNTPLDNDITFVLNKLHPTLTLYLDQQRGKTSAGEPFTWQKEILERLTPLVFPDIAATLKEHGADPGIYYGFLGILGAGLSNYHSKGDVTPEQDKTK